MDRRTEGAGGAGAFSRGDDLASIKERQLVVCLVGQLATAQFQQADAAMTQRLWSEVAALEIDPERITHLLYSGLDGRDRVALLAMDQAWCQQACPPRRAGFRPLRFGVWRRSVRSAAPPAHQPAR